MGNRIRVMRDGNIMQVADPLTFVSATGELVCRWLHWQPRR